MKSFLLAVAAVFLVAMLLLAACTAKEKTPAEEAPAATTTTPAAPAVPLPGIGMGISERYHDIHTKELQLKCDFCHTNMTATYYDPLAQVSNLADRRACLSCHKEGSAQPFYGEAWAQAKVQ